MKRASALCLFVVACVLAAACAFSLSGCDAPPMTTPESEKLAQLDERITDRTAKIEGLEAESKHQAELLADGDPANDAAAIARLQAIHDEYLSLAADLTADLDERGKLLDAAAERAGAPITGGLAAAFPQFAPIILAGGALASRLLAKRSREHLVEAARAALRLNLGKFVGGLLKSLGYTHSNTDPVAVLEGAGAAAEKVGSIDEAERIRNLAAALEAERALKKAPAYVP